jgi:hypothetical protein
MIPRRPWPIVLLALAFAAGCDADPSLDPAESALAGATAPGTCTIVGPWPDPTAGGVVTLSVTVARPQPLRLEVYDGLGRRVLEDQLELVGSGVTEEVSVDFGALAAGRYVVRASSPDCHVTRAISNE